LLEAWKFPKAIDNGVLLPTTFTAQFLSGGDAELLAAAEQHAPIFLGGHSLGGAYCNAIMQMLNLVSQQRQVWCFTVGSPKCQAGPYAELAPNFFPWAVQADMDGVLNLPTVLQGFSVPGLFLGFPTVFPVNWRSPQGVSTIERDGSFQGRSANVMTGLAAQLDITRWALGQDSITGMVHPLGEYARRIRAASFELEAGNRPADSVPQVPAVGQNDVVQRVPFVRRNFVVLQNFEGARIMSAAMPRLTKDVIPVVKKNGPDDFIVRWMGVGIAAYNTKAAANIYRRDLSRMVRRLCGAKIVHQSPIELALDLFLNRVSVDDGTATPPPNVSPS
jgi:hypothetical protein